MKIYIGFSRPIKDKIGAKAISWWINRPYSHVYVRFESQDPEIPSTVYHAAHGWVHFLDKERFDKNNKTVVEYPIEVTPQQRKKLLIKCMKLAFEKYSILELVNLFLTDVLFRLGCTRVKFHDPRGYICSELIAELLEAVFNVIWDKPKYLLHPGDIEDKLASLVQFNNQPAT